jgi:hypothetical protein
VSEFGASVREVRIGGVDQVEAFNGVGLGFGGEHRVADDGLGDLEEYHFASNVLRHVIRRLEGSNEAVVNYLCFLEVEREVLE